MTKPLQSKTVQKRLVMKNGEKWCVLATITTKYPNGENRNYYYVDKNYLETLEQCLINSK